MAADYSSFGLQDKIAIVTGASQGIGRAIAVGLARAGAIWCSRSIPSAGTTRSARCSRRSRRSAGRRGSFWSMSATLGRFRRCGADGAGVRPDRHPGQQRGLDR